MVKKSNLKSIASDLTFVYSEDKSISVIFQDNKVLMGVVGELNKNLKELEKLLILLNADQPKNLDPKFTERENF